jgi:hypothetical protein
LIEWNLTVQSSSLKINAWNYRLSWEHKNLIWCHDDVAWTANEASSRRGDSLAIHDDREEGSIDDKRAEQHGRGVFWNDGMQ